MERIDKPEKEKKKIDELEQIDGGTNSPLILHGAIGSGKTAFVYVLFSVQITVPSFCETTRSMRQHCERQRYG